MEERQIGFAEALNQVRQMANLYIKKIEDFVAVAATLEKNLEELESKRVQVRSEISGLEKKRDELSIGLKDKESTLAAVTKQLGDLKKKLSVEIIPKRQSGRV